MPVPTLSQPHGALIQQTRSLSDGFDLLCNKPGKRVSVPGVG